MSNIYKTYILIAFLTAIFVGFGYYVGGINGALIALVLGFLFNIIAFYNCGRLALRFYRAEELDRNDFNILYSIAAKLAHNANIPTPKLYLIPTSQPNAFATGRNPENGVIAITASLIEILSLEELEAVIAHEMAHIKNRDTLIMTITATIAGAIGILSNLVYFFIGINDKGEENPVAVFIMAVLAPIAATLVQLSISRAREYEADRIGAELCGKPLALAWALYKIEDGVNEYYNIPAERNPSTAHMFIINPLRGSFLDIIFSTHPSALSRIDKLVEMHEKLYGKLDRTQAYFKELEHRRKPFFKRIFSKKD